MDCVRGIITIFSAQLSPIGLGLRFVMVDSQRCLLESMDARRENDELCRAEETAPSLPRAQMRLDYMKSAIAMCGIRVDALGDVK